MKQLLAEFIGTFFLVFTVAISGDRLAVGLILAAMVYAFGPISGGHFNPAVTIGLWVNKKVKQDIAIRYILVQMLAGLAAAVAFWGIRGDKFTPSMSDSVTLLSAYAVELLFTFALVLVILNVAANEKVKGNQYFGLAIGLTLFVGATVGGSISGGVFNPAVGVAPILFNFSAISSNISNLALYILGPIAGALLASFVFNIMNDDKPVKASR